MRVNSPVIILLPLVSWEKTQCWQSEIQFQATCFRWEANVTDWCCISADPVQVLRSVWEAFHLKYTYRSHSVTENPWGSLGTINPRTETEGGPGMWNKRWREKEEQRDTHIPPILSEKIVLKIMKFLSNHFLFFSHFLKVFQELRSKKKNKLQKIKYELLYM